MSVTVFVKGIIYNIYDLPNVLQTAIGCDNVKLNEQSGKTKILLNVNDSIS